MVPKSLSPPMPSAMRDPVNKTRKMFDGGGLYLRLSTANGEPQNFDS